MERSKHIRDAVAQFYGRAARQQASSPGPCCCGPAPSSALATLAGYDREALAALPDDAVAHSFGCGNPIALAEIHEGDCVLDLGSGAGIDLLLAAKLAGPAGKVIGVDMTPAMIERARVNAEAAGLENVEVREGVIEHLPLEAESVDLVISNCVINLSPEKDRVFTELRRVLKPGGRFSISDIVAEPLPDWVREMRDLYSACIAGAIREEAYLKGLRAAGLEDVQVRDRLVYDRTQLTTLIDSTLPSSCCSGTGPVPAEQIGPIADALAGRVASIRVVGRKPGGMRLES